MIIWERVMENSRMKIKDVVAVLDEAFPLVSQDTWDNSGLIVGDPEMELRGILLSVDINEDVVAEAINRGCNMVVSHHPILFRGLKRINGKTDEERTIVAAIKNDIALCAFHTPADKSPRGLSYQLGRTIGLKAMTTFAPDRGGYEKDGQPSGYGVVGELDEAMDPREFMSRLKERLGTLCVKHSQCGRKVKRVAVCTGSGSEFIERAMEKGADAYVTSDIKYHQFQMGEGRLLIADVGHYESEELSKNLFFEILKEKMPTFAPCISDSKNIIKYY